ncbi:UNVERIFIED_CONTAM: hypothetical protein PYX00_001526 [Menopon gallinae]|uniref:C2H2-type domain-containing protein n=1 Tax=Menopon gallinae TaxID=328185 RepID=A0AAW2IEF3_9NEOP
MVAQTRSVAKNATPTTAAAAAAAAAGQQKTFAAQVNNGNAASSAATIVSPSPADQLKIYSKSPSIDALLPSRTLTEIDSVSALVSGNPDILICGNCREMFTELQELLDHKKSYCKLRFTCKCNTINGVKPSGNRKDAAALLCVQCKDSFQSAWDLMVHVQAAHMINIYELGVPKCVNGTQHSSPSTSPNHKVSDRPSPPPVTGNGNEFSREIYCSSGNFTVKIKTFLRGKFPGIAILSRSRSSFISSRKSGNPVRIPVVSAAEPVSNAPAGGVLMPRAWSRRGGEGGGERPPPRSEKFIFPLRNPRSRDARKPEKVFYGHSLLVIYD